MSPKPKHQWKAQDGEEDARPPSRSQRKRDSLALQKLGENIANASPSLQAKLPISDAMREALVEYRRLASREGKRRHLQYIGRLMREEADPENLAEVFENLCTHGTVA